MMVPLGNVAHVSTGYPFRKKVEPEERGDVVLVQIKDLDGAEGVAGTGSIALRNDGGRFDRYLLEEGDLLFQSRGSRHPVAMVGAGVRGIAATGLHTIRPDRGRVLPEYLAWWLNHPSSQAKFVNDVARGSYIPFVSKRDLDAFLVPAPPIDLQRRIIHVDRLYRREHELSKRLEGLTRQLVDGATLKAATRNS